MVRRFRYVSMFSGPSAWARTIAMKSPRSVLTTSKVLLLAAASCVAVVSPMASRHANVTCVPEGSRSQYSSAARRISSLRAMSHAVRSVVRLVSLG
jgi:hypothetical protein